MIVIVAVILYVILCVDGIAFQPGRSETIGEFVIHTLMVLLLGLILAKVMT